MPRERLISRVLVSGTSPVDLGGFLGSVESALALETFADVNRTTDTNIELRFLLPAGSAGAAEAEIRRCADEWRLIWGERVIDCIIHVESRNPQTVLLIVGGRWPSEKLWSALDQMFVGESVGIVGGLIGAVDARPVLVAPADAGHHLDPGRHRPLDEVVRELWEHVEGAGEGLPPVVVTKSREEIASLTHPDRIVGLLAEVHGGEHARIVRGPGQAGWRVVSALASLRTRIDDHTTELRPEVTDGSGAILLIVDPHPELGKYMATLGVLTVMSWRRGAPGTLVPTPGSVHAPGAVVRPVAAVWSDLVARGAQLTGSAIRAPCSVLVPRARRGDAREGLETDGLPTPMGPDLPTVLGDFGRSPSIGVLRPMSASPAWQLLLGDDVELVDVPHGGRSAVLYDGARLLVVSSGSVGPDSGRGEWRMHICLLRCDTHGQSWVEFSSVPPSSEEGVYVVASLRGE